LDEVQLYGTADADSFWWSPPELLSCTDCLTPEATILGPQWFVLQTISDEGCIASDSVFIEVFHPVYVPNSFTPNNDGVNDAFLIEGIDARGYRLEIFNRWGERLFYSEDVTEPWIGNDQRRDSDYFVPDGVYLWRLRYELADGPRILDGTVTIVR